MVDTFSIIIPLYNEAERIPKTIDEICTFFAVKDNIAEIVFVNDGSTDETVAVLERYAHTYAFRVISYAENRGKGYAVRQGIKATTGDWMVFFDIDLATPLAAFDDLVSTLSDTDAVVIGSRRVAGAEVKKAESRIRTFLGKGFTRLSNVLVPGIQDFTCGFKCFSRKAAETIFPLAQIDRWGFDTELLYIAHLKQLRIRQLPVSWSHDDDSRVKVVQAVVQSFRELCQMKWNHIRGMYS